MDYAATLNHLPTMICRDCGGTNPWVYYGPKPDAQGNVSCLCHSCTTRRGWHDADGNLKPEYSFN
jgi:hypothetical protein